MDPEGVHHALARIEENQRCPEPAQPSSAAPASRESLLHPRRAQALAAAIVLAATAAAGHATSSSTLWTNMTPDIQAFGVFHLGVDNYFTWSPAAMGRRLPDRRRLTVASCPSRSSRWRSRRSAGAHRPPVERQHQARAPEGALGRRSRALRRMFGLGTETGVTDYNVAYLTIARRSAVSARFGRTLPRQRQAPAQLEGEKQDTGFMSPSTAAFGRSRTPRQHLHRFVLAADYASATTPSAAPRPASMPTSPRTSTSRWPRSGSTTKG